MKILKNCVFQVHGVENIKLVASERISFNIVPKMVLFPKIYIKVYTFFSFKNDSSFHANKFQANE